MCLINLTQKIQNQWMSSINWILLISSSLASIWYHIFAIKMSILLQLESSIPFPSFSTRQPFSMLSFTSRIRWNLKNFKVSMYGSWLRYFLFMGTYSLQLYSSLKAWSQARWENRRMTIRENDTSLTSWAIIETIWTGLHLSWFYSQLIFRLCL